MIFRSITIAAIVILALSIFAASAPVTAQSSSLTILPRNCRVMATEKLSLELDGSLPATAVATWGVDYGGVASILPGSNAVLLAPSTPGVINVNVTILPDKKGPEITITRQCTVIPTDEFSG